MRQIPLALTLLASLAAAPASGSEDTSDLEGLLDQSVISTASKSAESSSAAPAVSSTITAEELRRYGIRSLDQALNFLSLGMVTETNLASAEIGARGVLLTRDYGSHVLLLIDGHALNEQWNGTAYFERGAAIPLELIDHIEVILGPGSVLYGSNAMLGVINVVTRRAKDFDGYHAVLATELPGALRGSLGAGRDFELFGQRAEAVFALEYFRSKGPALDYGLQEYGEDAVTGEPRRFSFEGPGTGVWGGLGDDALAAQVPVFHGRFSLGNFALTARAASFERSIPHSWGNFDDPGSSERDRWLSVDARYSVDLSAGLNLSARAYGDVYDYLQNARSAAAESCLEGQTGGCTYRLYGASRWSGLEAMARHDWLQDARFVTLAGVDARTRFVKSFEEYLDASSEASVHGVDLAGRWEQAVGAYLEQTLRPLSWLGFNAGARLDWDQAYGTHLSPRLAATVSPWSNGIVKAIYSEAFRAPTAYERYYADPMAMIAGSDLRPEVVRSGELAVEQRLGAQRLTAGVFYSRWSDMVVIDIATEAEIAAAIASGQLDPSVTEAERYRNVASLESYGLNLGFEGSCLERRLRYGLGLTVAHAAYDLGDGSEPAALMAAAQIFGNARVSYEVGGQAPVVALAARFAGRRPVGDTGLVDENGDDLNPLAPEQTELRLSLSGPVPGVAGLSYRTSGHYAVADRAPYTVGPTASREFVPLPQWLVGVGLQYDLR